MAQPPEIDVNQVVAYNVRLARELRGWTQEELADRLEPYLGQRLTQGSMSAIERASEGERRREFDAQELVVFAMVFDLPVIWFLLPQPGDQRLIRATTRPVRELYSWLLGRPDQLEPVYERLRALGIDDPTAAEEAVEKISGASSPARQWSYRQRRKDFLQALLDQQGDRLDRIIDELGGWIDQLRQIGIHGFVAQQTDDADYARVRPGPDEATPSTTADKTTQAGRGASKRSRKKADRRRKSKRGG